MIPEEWKKRHLTDCLIGSTVRNINNVLGFQNLRAVNKSKGMVPMKNRVMGKSVDRCKIVKKDWFAYNPMRLNVGSICRWSGDNDCIVSPDYVVFRCEEGLLGTDFFDHFRKSHRWNDFIENAGHGSVRVRIYLKDLAPLKINIPPLKEQKKIVQILSTWDKAIETVEKLIENSKARKKALLQQLLTGKKRFMGFEGEEWRETLVISIWGLSYLEERQKLQ